MSIHTYEEAKIVSSGTAGAAAYKTVRPGRSIFPFRRNASNYQKAALRVMTTPGSRQQHFVVASNDDDDDNWSQCSISYPLLGSALLFFSQQQWEKKHDFMDKILTSFDEDKKDDQTTTSIHAGQNTVPSPSLTAL